MQASFLPDSLSRGIVAVVIIQPPFQEARHTGTPCRNDGLLVSSGRV